MLGNTDVKNIPHGTETTRLIPTQEDLDRKEKWKKQEIRNEKISSFVCALISGGLGFMGLLTLGQVICTPRTYLVGSTVYTDASNCNNWATLLFLSSLGMGCVSGILYGIAHHYETGLRRA